MEPKISIIIPVYGTEKYLKRCLESVTNQNYKNLEIIIVNDCSPGEAEAIVSEYQRTDKRIKYVKHNQNKGLFLARMTGAKEATGDYIAFLDSDDYIAFDFYFSLITKIREKNADIAIGKTVREFEDGSRWVMVYHDCCLNFESLEGEKVREAYFGQQGRCFSWHTVWNKLYRKTLWDKCAPFYAQINEHVIMTEDIAFSSVLFFFARKVVTVSSSAYFYCVNEAASTNAQNTTMKKFSKNMRDITTVFNFVSFFLKTNKAPEKIVKDFASFRSYYAGMWLSLARETFVGSYYKTALSYVHQLDPGADDSNIKDCQFFDSLLVKWQDGLEAAKAMIHDPSIKYVSFDLFDTLVTRPLYSPEQIFDLIDYDFRRELGANISFTLMRKDGEAYARRKKGRSKSKVQDVTLDEIYEAIQESYGLENTVATKYKEIEMALEVALSNLRKSAKELFDLANALKKEVIIVSDMYLDTGTIKRILEKNGFHHYSKLYLSSEVGLTKHTGDLFKYVLNDLECRPNEILHIGDTWENDFVNPGKFGIQTFFFPKCREAFENIIKGQCTNKSATIGAMAAPGVIEYNSCRSSLGYGAMMSIVANKYFDNPYRTFQQESDFNADPYFIGYYPVGMHVYGFANWLLQESRKYGYKKLYFMSRDGYLPMLVYQKIATLWEDAPAAEYIYSSRKSLMPFIVRTQTDLFDFPTVITSQTPNSMRKMLAFCMDEVDDSVYEEALKKHDIDAEEKFKDREDYNYFIQSFIKEFYSETAHEKSKQLCHEYYSRIEEGGATVDMGYSGRIQGALSAAVGRGVDVFFVHADATQYAKEQHVNSFETHSFYEYTPCISGVSREHIFSSTEPSCVGFYRKKNKVCPVFEEQDKDVQERWVVEKLQEGALDFANDFIHQLGRFCRLMPIKPLEVSLSFEGFLRYASDVDLKIFSASYFEDEVWGGLKKINIADFIREQRNRLNGYSSLPSAPVIVYEDRVVTMVKNKFKDHPIIYKMLKKIYWALMKRTENRK